MDKVKRVRGTYDRTAVTITFPEETKAKQSFQAECDINTIMQKYQKTGLIQHVQKFQGSYGDFTSVADYQLSLNQVLAAQEAFEALPSSIRARFNNNPGSMLAFLEDPANRDEAVELGLVEPPPAPPPPEAPPGASGEAGTASTSTAAPPAPSA